MTDKERLETIKELVKKIESILYDEWRQQELTFLIESLYYAGHVDWLIQQAERGVEYDRYLISLEDNKHYVTGLEQQNKRYQEAINSIIEKAMFLVTNEEVYEAIQDAIKVLEEKE